MIEPNTHREREREICIIYTQHIAYHVVDTSSTAVHKFNSIQFNWYIFSQCVAFHHVCVCFFLNAQN